MQKLEIRGGNKISGTINISGSKNATLPILASTILSNKKITINNVPVVRDVQTMVELLKTIGSTIIFNKEKKTIKIHNKKKLNTFASYHLLKTMRAGVLVLGALLTKYKTAKVSLPGGCAIGSRPINLHLDALKKMGAKIKIKEGYIYASAKKGLKGCSIKFPKISVGATENILIAACFAKGETRLRNCAIEPEVEDLIIFLKKIGCKIKKKGKRSLNVYGISKLKPAIHRVIFDRIEAGTYILAAAITNGHIQITNINPKIISTEINLLNKMNIKIIKNKNFIVVTGPKKVKSANIETKPYPGFPTDLQAQIMALMCMANGPSKIREKIFENHYSCGTGMGEPFFSLYRALGGNVGGAGQLPIVFRNPYKSNANAALYIRSNCDSMNQDINIGYMCISARDAHKDIILSGCFKTPCSDSANRVYEEIQVVP